MPFKSSVDSVEAYITRDGSEIRELLHPALHPSGQVMRGVQSLAEARVAPGQKTLLHKHGRTEEIYHILAGRGVMQCGDEQFPVTVGDSILIQPGQAHCITNDGSTTLRFLCCCAPPYSHDDTHVLE